MNNEYKLTKRARTLARRCVRKLKRQHNLISTAESLTGGMVGQTIVSIPGASKVYEEGYITYSDYAKIKNLLIDSETIDIYGVASKEVAKLMAVNTMLLTGSDYAIATTGVAGPKRDSYNTKVGTVYIACASRYHVIVRRFNYFGRRNKIRSKATISAFRLLLDVLRKNL